MDRTNILMFEPYPFGKEGGNLKTQSYILEFVDKSKFNPILVAPFETEFTERVRKQGFECIIVPPPKRIGRYGGKCLRDRLFGRMLTGLSMIPYNVRLWSLMKEKKIDLVYCNCIRAVLCVAPAAKLRRKPVLWYIKGELQNRILDMIGFALSDRILFFCESNKNDNYPEMMKKYEDKVGILRIGIDPEEVARAEKADKSGILEELPIDARGINIIVLGQLYPPKGVHYLLKALEMLVDDFPDIKLYVVGQHILEENKKYREDLDSIINKNKLENNVVFTGWRTDALGVLSLMDILVHPSLSEGFGRAVLEAMALGKPVVASRVGGLREIIEDGENGFLVEPGKPERLAEKIEMLLKDKDLRDRFGRSAKKAVFSEYLIRDKISELEQIWCDMTR